MMSAVLVAVGGTPSSFMLTATAFLLCLEHTLGNTSDPDMFPGAPPIQYSSLSGPAFLSNTSNTVRAVAGGTAMLSCGVRNIHNYTVSWVRGSDIRLLTANLVTYTTEPRFAASHKEGDSQWLLKIHYAKLSDSGIYLCQVSTTPPISIPINLTVYEATARILPGHEAHVQTGSRLEIICEVEGCPPPAMLTWSRGSQTLLTTTSNTYHDQTAENDTISSTAVSRLTLERRLATPSDSGTYSCTSACTKAVNVTVHVLRGEELAAMQHHNGSHGSLASDSLMSFILMVFLLLREFLPAGIYPFLEKLGGADFRSQKRRMEESSEDILST